MNFIKKQINKLKKEDAYEIEELDEDVQEDDDEVMLGTKIKVIVALVVVAMATYVAYWVQEPTEIKVDLLDAEITEESEFAAATDDFPPTFEISIVDFSYVPSEITVDQGTTVIWTNKDNVAHTVTGDSFDSDPEWTMSSGSLDPGISFSYEFTQPGLYEYSCTFHPQMQGRIIVNAVDGFVETNSESLVLPEETEALSVTPEDELAAILEEADSLASAAPEPEVTILDMPVENVETASADSASPDLVTLNVDELLTNTEELHEAAMIADESDELATTGPEDAIYFAIFGVILYLNRRKIIGSLNQS